jgi:rRNA processing protein Krr1/Pno1
LEKKHIKYEPLVDELKQLGWNANPITNINVVVRGAIQEKSIGKPNKLGILKHIIKNIMKSIHQNSIKYFTYLVFDKETQVIAKHRLHHLPNLTL